jgi:hypothetical protein
MRVKCSSCGSENPDYAFYCGKCAAELKGDLTTKSAELHGPRPTTKIESILSRNLLRIEENAARKRRGLIGKLRGRFWRSGALVFKSELEEVTLTIDVEGHASVSRGRPAQPTIELVGPHDSFIEMFRNERNIGRMPSSIVVHMAGKELPDATSQQIFKSGIERLLRALFE